MEAVDTSWGIEFNSTLNFYCMCDVYCRPFFDIPLSMHLSESIVALYSTVLSS